LRFITVRKNFNDKGGIFVHFLKEKLL